MWRYLIGFGVMLTTAVVTILLNKPPVQNHYHGEYIHNEKPTFMNVLNIQPPSKAKPKTNNVRKKQTKSESIEKNVPAIDYEEIEDLDNIRPVSPVLSESVKENVPAITNYEEFENFDNIRPLSPTLSDVTSISTTPWSSLDENKRKCEVCNEVIERKDRLKLPCNHKYHEICFLTWVRDNKGRCARCDSNDTVITKYE